MQISLWMLVTRIRETLVGRAASHIPLRTNVASKVSIFYLDNGEAKQNLQTHRVLDERWLASIYWCVCAPRRAHLAPQNPSARMFGHQL